MQRLAPALLCVILLAGCGSGSSATPTATPPKVVAFASYTDKDFGFSFKYPKTWSVPAKGGTENNSTGTRQYVLDVTVPNNEAGMSVTLDGNVVPIPAFVNGHHGRIPNDPHTYVYYHRTVAQWPAMRIERYSGTTLDEIDTIFNTRKQSYDIRTRAANPPFSPEILAGYDGMVKTFRPPFS